MLKNSEISKYSVPRATHRTYTPEFKAQLVAACQRPGASIAALAGQQGMNANVLHRWLKEHQHSGRHQLTASSMRAGDGVTSPTPAFMPLTLPAATAVSKESEESEESEVKIKLRKGALSMVVAWPLSAAAELASWTAAVLK